MLDQAGKLVPVGTLGLIAIGASFDVGYFWGIGINSYSFFSLQEHLVFSLEAMPLGLAITAFVIGFALFVIATHNKLEERGERQHGSSGKKKRDNFSIEKVISVLSIVIVWGYIVIWKRYEFAILAVFTTILSLSTIFMQIIYKSRAQSDLVLIVIAIAASLSLAFGVGYSTGNEYVSKPRSDYVYPVDDAAKCFIIRAGEKGVLCNAAEGRRFLPWRDVRQISFQG